MLKKFLLESFEKTMWSGLNESYMYRCECITTMHKHTNAKIRDSKCNIPS